MARKNLAVMTVLAVCVMTAAAYLSVAQPSGHGKDRTRVDHLLRRLADDQPDIHREAAEELRALGPVAVDPLLEAARSDDRVLSDRAKRLLEEMGAIKARGDAARPFPGDPSRPGA